MKKYVLLTLIAFLWGSNALAAGQVKRFDVLVKHYNTNVSQNFTITPNPIYIPEQSWSNYLPYISEVVTIKDKGQGSYANCQQGVPNYYNLQCPGGITLNISANGSTISNDEPTQSCRMFQGDFVDGEFNSDAPRCIDFGGSTGGPNPQPLYCLSNALLATANGLWTHELTATSCAVPSEPDPNPDPDPDPNPDPDPDPNDGTTGGTTQPTSGTTGTSTGINDGKPVNLVTDFKPVTERLDLLRQDQIAHTNYLGTLIYANTGAVNTNTQATIAGNGHLANIAGKIDQTNGKLDQTNSKLDGIGDSLESIKDALEGGEPYDGEGRANDVQLPNYDAAVADGVNQVRSKVLADSSESGLENFNDPNYVRGLFSGADSIAEIFNIARSSCAPINIGSHGKLDLCPYAPTVSTALEFVIWALTALFVFRYLHDIVTRERLT